MPQQIQAVIVKLHQDNKPVTFGLVKTKLNKHVPLAYVTREISQYKLDPSVYYNDHKHLLNHTIAPETQEQASSSTPDDMYILKGKVISLEKQVASMQKQIDGLIDFIKNK